MDDKQFRLTREDAKRRQEIANKAGDHHLRPGSIIDRRYVDPNDYERWKRSRDERKSKNHTLDPHR